MSLAKVPTELRHAKLYHHIDMGFLNRRLCLTALPPDIRSIYHERMKPGTDHMTVLANDHLLVTMLLDVCDALKAPTLLEALTLGEPSRLFRSTERLAPCPEVYEAPRVSQAVILDVDFEMPVIVSYHTEHLVSSTGKMVLAAGAERGHVESMVGVVRRKDDVYEIEPLVMGAPWFEHARNGHNPMLMWLGRDLGEVLPEDVDQFSDMTSILPKSAEEWLDVMANVPEREIKTAFTKLLAEPSKSDWGGETNDHFSNNVSIGGRRTTAAFLFKGPAVFREMTLDMCGKRADQIHRLTQSGAEISIVQNSHLIGETVRKTLRCLTVYPGASRKYCFIDGLATYRILKAYSLI